MFSKKQKKLKTVQLITKRKKLSAQLIVKQLQIVQLITKQKKLSTQWISKLTILFSKKVKEIENSSADY